MNLSIFGFSSAVTVIESILRIFTYIALITFLYTGLKALNVYIDKNTRQH